LIDSIDHIDQSEAKPVSPGHSLLGFELDTDSGFLRHCEVASLDRGYERSRLPRNVTRDPTSEWLIYQVLSAFRLDPVLGLAAVNILAVRTSCWRQKTQ
jgi:hypothetical protein